MSFMVVNTGRAASRAFYLGLKRLEGVVSLSRYELDHAVSRFTERRRSDGLRRLVDAYRMAGALRPDVVAGLVFHGVARRLLCPYPQPRNERVLEILRDELGIRTVYFVVREPRAMLRSELNRALAARAGDWSFERNPGSWQGSFTFEEVAGRVDRPPRELGPIEPGPPPSVDELRAMVLAATERSGKIHALLGLLQRVFREVRYVDYEDFVAHPVETYRRMAAISGFTFVDHPLVHAKLNGLSNRLLAYNPIRMACPASIRRGLLERRLPPLRYRIELSAVLPLCDDWRHFETVTTDCSRYLEPIEADFQARLSLGVRATDVARYPRVVGEVLRSDGLAQTLLAGLGPTFVANYRRTKELYERHLYVSAVPDEVWDAFWAEHGREHEAVRDARERGRLAPI